MSLLQRMSLFSLRKGISCRYTCRQASLKIERLMKEFRKASLEESNEVEAFFTFPAQQKDCWN